MRQRDALLVLGAVILAIGVSALLLAGSLSNGAGLDRAARARGIFFERSSPPPARAVTEVQRNVPTALQPIVPLQRGLTDTARDAAGYLLVLLGTSSALVLARAQVTNAYRASLGGWRSQLRVLATGLAVIGVGASAAALAWIVFLGSISAGSRAGPFGVPAALQIGLAAFSVALVGVGLVTLVGFAAASWRLGDALLQLGRLRRYTGALPAPLMALLGATFIYVAWQVPYAGPAAVILALAYALGAVVMARLATPSNAVTQ